MSIKESQEILRAVATENRKRETEKGKRGRKMGTKKINYVAAFLDFFSTAVTVHNNYHLETFILEFSDKK